MKILTQVIAPTLCALMLASCAGVSADGASQTDLPAICIVSGEDASGGPSADYMGQTVNFCCKRCKAKWDGMDDSAKKAAFDNLAN